MINDNDLIKYRKELSDKMMKDKNNKEKSEDALFLLILILTGISFIFNNIAPIAGLFIYLYYETNKDKINK